MEHSRAEFKGPAFEKLRLNKFVCNNCKERKEPFFGIGPSTKVNSFIFIHIITWK